MTANEIIKALEAEIQCCEYFDASRADGVSLEFLKDTLAYINRQKAEIERLNAMVAAAEEHLYPLPFKTAYDEEIQKAKSEAIKEFAEKLKKNLVTVEIDGYEYNVISEGGIDYCVEEMVGEDDG